MSFSLGHWSLWIHMKMTWYCIKSSDVFPLNEHPSHFPLTLLCYWTMLDCLCDQGEALLNVHLGKSSLFFFFFYDLLSWNIELHWFSLYNQIISALLIPAAIFYHCKSWVELLQEFSGRIFRDNLSLHYDDFNTAPNSNSLSHRT